MRFTRLRPPPATPVEVAHEVRLVDAESRANTVYEKALWLHTIVVRRDQANHWQESVNQMFQGRA